MEMIYVFISQPMKGLPDEEIEATRDRAEKKLKELFPDYSIEIMSSFFKNQYDKARLLELLSHSLEIMSGADVVYFCKNWQKYRDCSIEHLCAKSYGYKVIEEDNR